jgi:predicted metal-dependent peptidase
MKFSKIIGKIEPDLICQAEKKLEKIFLELGLNPKPSSIGTGLGGSPLLFALMFPVEHIATTHVPTAATTGRKFFWNIHFILSKSLLGLRLICCHEAWHCLYMHAQRRGRRDPHLWNIAVDYLVNFTVMDDLKLRGRDPAATFKKELGNFLTLSQLEELCKDPKAIPDDFDTVLVDPDMEMPSLPMPHPEENRDLTQQEKDAMEEKTKMVKFFFADPKLPEAMRSPEKIYQYLLDLQTKYPDSSVFDFGGTIDEHMDAEESQEEMAKRIARAMDMTKRMAGKVPGALEDELGALLAPKIRFQDAIRAQMLRSRDGHSQNDWTRFRSRAFFAGLLIPKRIDQRCKFACLLDTSMSMSKDNMAYGVSQLQSLDQRAEGSIVYADAKVYWDKAIKLQRFNKTTLQNLKPVGRGGTVLASYFDEYKKHLGQADFLIVITDGGLLDEDLAKMKNPQVPVFWLITNEGDFVAPFGKVYKLGD